MIEIGVFKLTLFSNFKNVVFNFSSTSSKRLDDKASVFKLIKEKNSSKKTLPFVPSECNHNGHLYYLKLQSQVERDKFIQEMSKSGITCAFHYIPLHSSIAGERYGRVSGSMEITDNISSTIVRLPLWAGIEQSQDYIIKKALSFFGQYF